LSLKKACFHYAYARYRIKLVGPLYKRYTGINSRIYHNTFHNYFISTDVISPFLYSTFSLSDTFILGFEGGSPVFKKRLTYSILLRKLKLKWLLHFLSFFVFF